jgi:hypothetical protein
LIQFESTAPLFLKLAAHPPAAHPAPLQVHALKPNPKSHIQEGWRIADFFSHVPEAMHM